MFSFQNVDILAGINRNVFPWQLAIIENNDSFISPYFEYYFSNINCLSIMLAPVISCLDGIYCTFSAFLAFWSALDSRVLGPVFHPILSRLRTRNLTRD